MSVVEPIRKLSDLKKIEQILLAKDLRDLLLFKIGINWGLRISDILSMNVSDVKDKDYCCLVEKKTKKKRVIPINENLKKLLNIFLKNRNEYEPLFVSKISKKRLDRTNAYRIIHKACENIKIEGNIGTHTLRKTFGYHYYKKYKDIVMLQKILNHSNPNITLRYIGITQEEILNSYKDFIL